MKIQVISFLILIIITTNVFAQITFESGADACSYKKRNMSTPLFSLSESPNSPKHSFDVLDYKLYLDIYNCFFSPYPKNFTASVTIKFRVDTALSSIQLHAVNTSLQILGVSMSGVSFTHSNNILTVNLNRTYNPNEIVYVKIDYNHLNVSDGAFYVGGGGVMTDAEPEGARKWFPCYDRPFDKATTDITIKVPLSVRLGSNGRLNDSTVTGDTIYYHWISRDPVATYLVVLSARINYKLNIVYAGSTPIRFYYINSEGVAPQSYIVSMFNYYSGKFGPHPFEKDGFTTAAVSGFPWGGMENQTLTTLCSSCWDVSTVAHEFAHQWFGDAVTCGTWADIWLNEGYATYIEALWREYTGGYANYKNRINSQASSYLSSGHNRPIYMPHWAYTTPPNDSLFDVYVTYYKAGCVLHMLRYVVQDTAVFFNLFRGYYGDTANFKYKDAITDDYTAKISDLYGSDLSWFINQWVKQPAHPVYQNYYFFTTNSGSSWSVGFQARQIQTNTPFHRMPIVIRITFTSGPDTNIRVDNNVNYQSWFWDFNRTPSTVTFDPNNDIVLKTATTIYQVFNAVSNNELPVKFAVYQNYPNPFNPLTRIDFELPKQSVVVVKIYNAAGRLVAIPLNESRPVGRHTIEFDGGNLASGMYYYELTAGDFREVKKMVLIK